MPIGINIFMRDYRRRYPYRIRSVSMTRWNLSQKHRCCYRIFWRETFCFDFTWCAK